MEFLRSEDAKIVPTCSFLRHYMDKNEDTQDLRAEPEPDEDEDQGQDHAQDHAEDHAEDQDPDDEDSPEAGPADAKAAGSGGAAEETEDEPATEEQP